jgi:hypothetical protein
MRTTSASPAEGGAAAPAPPRAAGTVPQPRGDLAEAVVTAAPRTGRLRATFQLPDGRNPVPHPIRLLAICTWAAGLGLVGLPIAARSSIAIIAGAVPGWFEPVVVAVGMLGILVTATTFAAMHHRWLPWLLLLVGTVALVGNLLLILGL